MISSKFSSFGSRNFGSGSGSFTLIKSAPPMTSLFTSNSRPATSNSIHLKAKAKSKKPQRSRPASSSNTPVSYYFFDLPKYDQLQFYPVHDLKVVPAKRDMPRPNPAASRYAIPPYLAKRPRQRVNCTNEEGGLYDEITSLQKNARLTIVAFVITNDLKSAKIAERTEKLMLDYDLVRSIQFVEVHAINRPDLAAEHSVNYDELPTILFLSRGRHITRQVQPTPEQYEQMVKYQRFHEFKWKLNQRPQIPYISPRSLITSSKVVVLMNGDEETTWCQDSKLVMGYLDIERIPYTAHNVFMSEQVWNGLWAIAKFKIPFPHVYLNGEMIGGYEVMGRAFLLGNLKDILNVNDVNLIPKMLEAPPPTPTA